MKKRNVVSVVVVAMLLAVSLFFVGKTYAKYTNEFSGTGTVGVAKWAVKVANQESASFNLTLTTDSDSNVVSGKIAPSYTASGEVEVDLTGTEVAVELKAKTGALTGALANYDKVKVTTTVEKQGSAAAGTGDLTNGYKIALPSGSAFTATNGKYKVKVTVQWPNDAANDATDTTKGKTGGNVSVPLTLTLTQQVKSA